MLHSAKRMKDFTLAASDGPVGRIGDFYFDDSRWVIRYAVAQAGNRLTGRMVLLSPQLLRFPEPGGSEIRVALTAAQIRASPSPESDRPVSRQFEEAYYRHFGWPYYWAGPHLWGPSPYPVPPAGAYLESMASDIPAEPRGDPHLRSTGEIVGYHLRARDGEIGHVEDFLFDDADWSIRYLAAGTRNWWPGRQVLVPPGWISAIHWEDRHVDVDTRRETIRMAPGYAPSRALSSEQEARLEGYFSAAAH